MSNFRVTGAEVKAIMDTDISDGEVEPFIETAHLLINRHLEDKISGSDAEDILKKIELWLSAHFAAMLDSPRRSESIGAASQTEEVSAGALETGLTASRYGQQALALDPTGILRTMNRKPIVFDAMPRRD